MKLSFVLLGGLFVALSAQAAPTSYPLKCRGTKSGELLFEFSPTTAELGFKKAAAAAPRGLNPGECAWMDRALNADEPSRLVQYPQAPKSVFGTTTIRYGFTYSGAAVVAPLIGGRDPEIQWMKDLMNPDNYWLFQVYNDRAGHLVVTSAAPATN